MPRRALLPPLACVLLAVPVLLACRSGNRGARDGGGSGGGGQGGDGGEGGAAGGGDAPGDGPGEGPAGFRGELPWPTDEAAEVAVAARGDRVAMAANSLAPGGFHAGVLCSDDGGRTWGKGSLPSMPAGTASDPSLAFADDGRLYLAFLRTGPGDNYDIRVAVSDDGCASWAAPVLLTTTGRLGSYDKPHLAVVGSRAFVVYFNAGTLRVTEATGGAKGATSTLGGGSWPWLHGGKSALWAASVTGGQVMVARSDDLGGTWKPRVAAAAGPALAGAGMGMAGDEDLLVLSYTTSTRPRHVDLVRSTDGGLTWSVPERLTGPDGGFFPWPLVTPGRVLVMLYAGRADGPGDLRVLAAPRGGPFDAPVILDDAAFPQGWVAQVTDRRLGDYNQMAVAGSRIVVGWTHAPTSTKGRIWASAELPADP